VASGLDRAAGDGVGPRGRKVARSATRSARVLRTLGNERARPFVAGAAIARRTVAVRGRDARAGVDVHVIARITSRAKRPARVGA